MHILAYPLCLIYLVVFFFFPRIATIILLVSAILLWLYILLITKMSKFRDDDFSKEEKKLLYKYPIYFRFYFGSITISAFLSVVQMSTIIMAIILLWKHHWLYLIPIVVVYFIFANSRPKFDPLFFLKELYARQKDPFRQMEVKRDIDFMIAVYNKFWGYDKKKEIPDTEFSNKGFSDHDLNKLSELIEKNKYDEAIEKIDKILSRDKNNVEAYNYKAGILQLTGKQDEAINLYKYIIENFNYIDSYIELIEVYDLDNKRNAAKIIDLCKKLELIDKNKMKTPYYLMARSYNKFGDYELALETYDKAIGQEKLNIEVYTKILKDPKYKKDIKDEAKDRINNSKLYEAYCGKASVLETIEKYEEAINNYKEAITINIEKNCEHESYLEYESIADIYDLLGDTKEVSYYFKKAKVLEKISNDLYDKKMGYMTEDEFNKWYDDNVELDDEGNIINIKSNKKDKNGE